MDMFEESSAQQKLSELFAKAEQGDAKAQCQLASRYQYGNGVEQSDEEAAKWYRKAAEQGNVEAQFRLACCYEQGKGVKKSLGEALKWYKKAGRSGDKIARERAQLLLKSGKFKEVENNFKEEDEEEMKGRWAF